jgi:hypothetical protein
MKISIFSFLFFFVLCAPFLASAQEESAKTGLIQQADVIRCYRRVKLDMEDKARNVKDMKKVSLEDVEKFQAQYNALRKDFNQFLAQFTDEIDAANGTPIDFCDLNKTQLEQFLTLYAQYESGFLDHYEQLTGTNPKPLMEAGFTANIKNCEPKSISVKPETYHTQYQPELIVSTWNRL